MKKLLAILLAALMLLGLAACGANSAMKEDYYAPEDNAYSYGDAPAPAETAAYNRNDSPEAFYETPNGSGKSEDAAAVSGGQKLIRKIRLTVETDDYQAFIEALNGKIAELGGYVEDMEASTSGITPRATIVVRVPANQLSALTDGVAGIGNITYKHDSQQDVTLQYVDTESRISALRTEQERLLALLEQAENLTEVLEIEDRLSYVRYELESYERSLRALANQVEYATATIEVSQVRVFTPVETEEEGYWEKIGNGLKSSLSGLWEFLKDLFSLFVIALPYLFLFVILPLIILIVLLKRHSRRRKAKLEAEAAAKQAQSLPEAEAKE